MQLNHVTIAGVGIAGLANAITLSRCADAVLLVERAPGPRPEGYLIDFSGPGIAAARRIGVAEQLVQQRHEFTEMRSVRPDGSVSTSISLAPVLRLTPHETFTIMRPDLERGLRACLPANVRVRYNTVITHLDTHAEEPDAGVHVTLSDQTSHASDLCIVAEGLRSATRDHYITPHQDVVRSLNYAACAWLADDPELAEILGQRFAMSEAINSYMGAARINDRHVSVFGVYPWHGQAAPAPELGVALQHLESSGSFGRRLARHAPQSGFYCDLVAQSVLPSWSNGAALAMGDTAHAVSLVTGLGSSMALCGADQLAQSVRTATSLKQAITRYEASWRPQVERVQAMGRRRAKSFVPSSRAALMARRVGMQVLRLPIVGDVVARSVVRSGDQQHRGRASQRDQRPELSR